MICYRILIIYGFPDSSVVKNPPAIPGIGKIPWRRKWQPNPIFLPGKPHGRGAWQEPVSMGSQKVGHG